MTTASTPNPGAFGIEKLVVVVTATGALLLGAIHATGWILAVATGNPTPAFTPGRALAALGLNPYVPGVPPVAARAPASGRRGTGDGRGGAGRAAPPLPRRRTQAPRRVVRHPGRLGHHRGRPPRRLHHRLMAQARTLRPRLDRPAPADVGYLLGSSRGQDVWASCERSILVVGPPGSGKGLHIAINAILDAPGAVITTSTKPDNIKATLLARSRTGPVGVFDPQGMLGAGFAHQVAWDAVAGCEDPIRAATRAEALAANTGITTSGENASWRGHAKTIIECVLHAAALNGEDIETAYRWMQSTHAMDLPLRILEAHPDACLTWDSRLRGLIHNPDPRFVGSVMSVVSSAITPLSLPTVRAALTPVGVAAGDLRRVDPA